jgi:hypothetical protein
VSGAVVALSVDDTPSYTWLARRCIRSLRRSGTELQVVVFASRGAALELNGLANVEVIDVEADRHENPFLERWYRLARLEVERIVFLDADTICLQPLELLLDAYRLEDIYGRQEAGTYRPPSPIGDPFPAQVDWEAFDRLRDLSGGRRPPVVNAGTLVFNHGALRNTNGFLDAVCEIYDGWASGAVPYPCTNRRLMDELAFSCALSRPGSPTLGLLAAEDAPFYAELGAGVPSGGIVLHVWSGLYRSYLQEFGEAQDVAAYDYLRRRDRLHRIQAVRGRAQASVLR